MTSARKTPVPVAFVHIPKAGGTTLHSILDRQYPKETDIRCDMQIPGVLERMLALTPEQRARALCIRGHMPYGTHCYMDQQVRYITMLRDPVKRVISKYRNILRNPQRALDLNFPTANVGDLETFTAMQVERNAMNFQTRMLAGYLDLADPVPPFPPLPDDALAKAMAHIQQDFAVVGVMERFDESLVLMKRELGWGNLNYARQNVGYRGPSPQKMPSATEDRLRELNHLDDQLYQYALQELDRQVAAQGPDFQAEVERTRNRAARVHSLQKIYNRQPLKGLRRIASKIIRRR